MANLMIEAAPNWCLKKSRPRRTLGSLYHSRCNVFRSTRYFAILLICAGLSPAISGASAHSAGERVVLAVDGTQQLRNLPVLLAERLGYFREQGLIVTLVDAPADPSISQLVSDGRADGTVAYYHHTFESQIEGDKPAVSVLVMGATPQLKLVAAERLRGQVRELKNLAGKRIITGGINSGKTTTMTMLAMRGGFGPVGYTRLPLSSRDAMIEALRTGGADAIVAHEPDASDYVRAGVGFVLANVNSVPGTKASLGDVYPTTALYLPKAFVRAHRQEVQKLVDACLKAMTFINSHTAAQIAAVLPVQMIGKDRTAYLAKIEEDRLSFATDGRMSLAAAQAMYNAMLALQPKYAPVTLSDTYTNEFVERAGKP
jgi:NitT/TauT family transport system substrate-binding protein